MGYIYESSHYNNCVHFLVKLMYEALDYLRNKQRFKKFTGYEVGWSRDRIL